LRALPEYKSGKLWTVSEEQERAHRFTKSVELPRMGKSRVDGNHESNARKLTQKLKELLQEISALREENKARYSLFASISAQYEALKTVHRQYRDLRRNQRLDNLVISRQRTMVTIEGNREQMRRIFVTSPVGSSRPSSFDSSQSLSGLDSVSSTNSLHKSLYFSKVIPSARSHSSAKLI
jgi:hypothetical protein